MKAKAPRRPPTEAKLRALLIEHAEDRRVGWGPNPTHAEIARSLKSSDAIRKLYVKGLPRNMDAVLVAEAVTQQPPFGHEIARIVRQAGSEYDAALVAGAKRVYELQRDYCSIDLQLVAALVEHGGAAWSEAAGLLLNAERAVDLNPNTNAPSETTRAALDRVAACMAPWFEPGPIADRVLEIADARLGPHPWTDRERAGVTAIQGDEEWALFIGCAFHPSPGATAVLQKRVALIARIDAISEPARDTCIAVLRQARAVHGAGVPCPE